jgi:hypothetical protein
MRNYTLTEMGRFILLNNERSAFSFKIICLAQILFDFETPEFGHHSQTATSFALIRKKKHLKIKES